MRQFNENIIKVKNPSTGEFVTLPNLAVDATDSIDVENINCIAEVAKTGDYNDLINLPDLSNFGEIEVSDIEPTDTNVNIWIDTAQEESYKIPQINDTTISEDDTWSSSKIDKAISYSTEETPTGGTWIDGKPIYKRILTGSWLTGNSDAVQTLDAMPDVETVIDLHGHLKTPSGSCYSLNCYHSGATNAFMRLSWQDSTKQINIDQGGWNASTYAGSTYVIHFEYTKTTD